MPFVPESAIPSRSYLYHLPRQCITIVLCSFYAGQVSNAAEPVPEGRFLHDDHRNVNEGFGPRQSAQLDARRLACVDPDLASAHKGRPAEPDTATGGTLIRLLRARRAYICVAVKKPSKHAASAEGQSLDLQAGSSERRPRRSLRGRGARWGPGWTCRFSSRFSSAANSSSSNARCTMQNKPTMLDAIRPKRTLASVRHQRAGMQDQMTATTALSSALNVPLAALADASASSSSSRSLR